VTAAALLSLASLILGLFSLTGRDCLPRRVRRLLRRIPASAADFRLRGVSLVLNGSGVLVLASLVARNTLVGPPSGFTGYAPASDVAFERGAMFITDGLLAIAAIAIFGVAYAVGVRVRYLSTRASRGTEPGLPPAR
jgi:hypothetical protein